MRKNCVHISISGYQPKASLVLAADSLRYTLPGERGQYILKPIPDPHGLRHAGLVPANEHLTMQLAQQVFGIPTAPNALVYFKDGVPAYLVRRFDWQGDQWLPMEEFSTLAQAVPETLGVNYKYERSYEGYAELIRKYVSTSALDLERYFALLAFNFLFANGDAHARNFALLRQGQEYRLAPAYDLLMTQLHLDDSPFALKQGLFVEGQIPAQWQVAGQSRYPGKRAWLGLAIRLGLRPQRAERILLRMYGNSKVFEAVEALVAASFLPPKYQRSYLQTWRERRNWLAKE